MARKERDQAVRERNEAQQRIGYLWAELGTAMTQRLEAESVFHWAGHGAHRGAEEPSGGER